MIKISIVTATFNRIKKLKSLYQNLKNQKNKFFFELEWVVIAEQNDFKTIHFLKSISEFKVKIVINKHYKKFSSLIKQGIDNTAGDYISVVGDDDFFFKNSLEIVVKKILSNNKPKILVGYADYKDRNNIKIRSNIGKIKKLFLNTNSRLLLGFVNYYMCPAVFFKKDLTKKINCFPINYSNINDYITWLQIRNLYKPIIIKQNIANVGFEKGTISYSFNIEKYIFMWKIYLKSKNYFYLLPLKIIFSIMLLIYNYTYRALDLLLSSFNPRLSRGDR